MDDIKGVLDHLAISQAHVCGLSMGAYATLIFGLTYPERALSLTVAGGGYGSAADRDAFRKITIDMAERLEREGMASVAATYSRGPTRVVGVWVSDGELADSMFWNVTVVASGVNPLKGTLPTVYALDTPHPNPFNPITTLVLSLPQAGIVQLWVYDVRGQVVARLVDGWMSAGNYHLGFDASGLAGGVYFAKMTAGDYSFVR